MRPWHRLRLGATITVERRPDAGEGEQRAVIAVRKPHHVLVSGFQSGAYSAKLLAATKQRFSTLSHARQCGDDVLRMSVTGYPPVRDGGGVPQRISSSAFQPRQGNDYARFVPSTTPPGSSLSQR
jgi:hypothetical protein